MSAAAALQWACGSDHGFGNDAGTGDDASNDAILAPDCSFCGVETSTKESGPVYDPCHVPPDNSGDN
ncbi:MAG TPA: hypothetical protein VGH87_16035, partial [Polyangiaceae bacterium]